MNRELKFRAWDIGKSLFIPVEQYAIITTDFGAFGVMIRDWENYKEGEYFYSNSQILSQYTGLKDKNGKEIYEGDILTNKMVVLKVEFYNYMWWLTSINGRGKDCSLMGLAWVIVDKYEIIGNIFEQPNQQ